MIFLPLPLGQDDSAAVIEMPIAGAGDDLWPVWRTAERVSLHRSCTSVEPVDLAVISAGRRRIRGEHHTIDVPSCVAAVWQAAGMLPQSLASAVVEAAADRRQAGTVLSTTVEWLPMLIAAGAGWLSETTLPPDHSRWWAIVAECGAPRAETPATDR